MVSASAFGLASAANNSSTVGRKFSGGVRPVEQHAAQAGDDAGHTQLLVQQIVKQGVLPTKAVVAPERLNAQQIHGQDLPDHPFMGGADLIGGIRLPQQARVLKQTGMHRF